MIKSINKYNNKYVDIKFIVHDAFLDNIHHDQVRSKSKDWKSK
jgi:hypothetical protein